MVPFHNESLDLSALPNHTKVSIHPVHPNYWMVIAFNLGLVFLILGTVITIFVFGNAELRPISGFIYGIYIVLFGFFVFFQRMAFRRRGYALRQRDLIYRYGVLSVVTTIVPFNRIQHVAINEGFLSRHYGLAQLQLFTAGGSSSDIRLSGLEKEKAERMKELIMRQISGEEEGSQDKGIATDLFDKQGQDGDNEL